MCYLSFPIHLYLTILHCKSDEPMYVDIRNKIEIDAMEAYEIKGFEKAFDTKLNELDELINNSPNSKIREKAIRDKQTVQNKRNKEQIAREKNDDGPDL